MLGMTTKIKKGKDILLAVNPRFKSLKDGVVNFFILKVLIPADETVEGIRSKLKKKYQISLDEFVLKEALNKLKNDNFISTNGGSEESKLSAKAYFHAKNKAKKTIKNISDKRHGSFELVANWISDHIPEQYKKELLDKKEDIVIDLIHASSKVADKFFYQISLNKEFSPSWSHLECQVKGISPELKMQLEKIYDKIWSYQKDPAIRELLNLNFFWSAFLRIFSYEKAIQNSLSENTKSTHIFLDTNTIIADISHFDSKHETTRDYLNFLKNIDLKIYYTPETRDELDRHLEKVKNIVNALKYYPAAATRIAEGCNSPLVKSYIEEAYINWDFFYQEFMETLKNRYSMFELSEAMDKESRSNGEAILSDVEKIMQKRIR
jgi:DNA-binding PadR family transcriptional regulator